MSENKVVIPCEVLKRITPLLERCICYEHIMFRNEFEYLEAVFLVGRVTDDTEKLKQGAPYYLTEDEINFFLRKRKWEGFIPDYDEIYDFVLRVGNNLTLPIMSSPKFPPLSIAEFDKIWDNYKLPHDDYYHAFLVLIAVYSKYICTNATFDCEAAPPYSIRMEQLKLLQLLWRTPANGLPSIKISYNGKSLTIDNYCGWLKKMLYASLGGNMDIKDIENELKEKYTFKTKTGRKKKKGQCNLLLSAYNLIHRTTLKTGSVILNDQEAFFLLEFLKYLQLNDKKKEMDAVYMRALLSHYQAEKSIINWWYFE